MAAYKFSVNVMRLIIRRGGAGAEQLLFCCVFDLVIVQVCGTVGDLVIVQVCGTVGDLVIVQVCGTVGDLVIVQVCGTTEYCGNKNRQ